VACTKAMCESHGMGTANPASVEQRCVKYAG
jgi:hypothetical protein